MRVIGLTGSMFDLIIANGIVVDGSGNPAFKADIGIEGERIVACERSLADAEALRRIDADGLTVTPGFIDAHSHSDTYLLLEPDAPSKLSQGITTEINGQCGGSAVPRLGPARLPSDWNSQFYPALKEGALHPSETAGPTWSTVAEYRALFEAVQPAVNSVQLVGHNTLRAGVIGYESRPARADEIKVMVRRLEEALEMGCHGVSTGLLYQPGKYAESSEIETLAAAVARHGGFYATHMRCEGNELEESVDEVLALARCTGVQVQISHLKTSGPANWHKIDRVLETLNRARGQGINLQADRYPYLAGGTELDVVLPAWAEKGGSDEILRRVRDADSRARIIEYLDQGSGRDWEQVMIGGGWSDLVRGHSGRTVAAAAASEGVSAGELVCRCIDADQARTGAFFFGMSQENLNRIFNEDWIMPGCDASLRAPWGVLGADHPHPRAYGTMPRYLRMICGVIDGCPAQASFEEGVRRMTSLPATTFKLKNRGQIARGAFADLVVLERGQLLDKASYAKPHQFSEGINYTIVNGAVSYEGAGRFTGSRRGRLL
ncbi:MAG: amidohydrolase family protein [Kiritimatiellae bacterium]|nr:amidohydrolase family protein [Kiritimatiellia bacterium]